jgi:hypothetical protein
VLVIECQQKADAVETIELTDRAGATVTTFTGAATLAAEVWAGDDQAVLFAPGASWADAAAGRVTLAFGRDDTADLAAGDYAVMLTVTAGGYQRKRRVATLRVLSSPGTAEALATYCGAEDLRRVCAWIDELQADTDQAGFAEARAEAREWTDQVVQAHAPASAGAGHRMEGAWMTRGAGRDAWLRAQLDAGRLVVTPSVRRANALYAVGLVLLPQVGQRGETSYQALAARYLGMAEDLLLTLEVELDTDGDGEADYAIPLQYVDVVRG